MNGKHVIMAIMAHPDDAELRCFGTLCKYQDMGYSCINLIVCNGENGVSLSDKERTGIDSIPKLVRFNESQKSFKNTQIELVTLGFSDSSITVGRELIIAIEEKIRQYKPEIIITHYPDEFCADHQDHYNVGRATINCATRSENVKRILLCEPQMAIRSKFVPNCYVNITPYFDKKMKALSCHKSQAGRFYLDEKYHETKSLYYAASVGFNFAKNDERYEAFYIQHCVE